MSVSLNKTFPSFLITVNVLSVLLNKTFPSFLITVNVLSVSLNKTFPSFLITVNVLSVSLNKTFPSFLVYLHLIADTSLFFLRHGLLYPSDLRNCPAVCDESHRQPGPAVDTATSAVTLPRLIVLVLFSAGNGDSLTSWSSHSNH